MSEPKDLFDVMGEEGKQFKKPSELPPIDRLQPEAKRLFDEHNAGAEDGKKLDANKLALTATGKDGAITKADVERAVEIANRPPPKATTTVKKPAPEPDVYEIPRTVYYAGNRITVPDPGMKHKDVHAMLEDTFPELTKERSELVYEVKKGAAEDGGDLGVYVPVLKGHKKGTERPRWYQVYPDATNEIYGRPVVHLAGPDGVYEFRKTQAGVFCAKVPTALTPFEGFRLGVPPVPAWTLDRAVGVFKAAPETEQLANIVYDRTAGRYGVHVPSQTGQNTTVSGEAFFETEDRFVVVQLHSHGTMAAFFSATDDADEVRTGLYGVVGRCDEARPQLAMRYSCGGMYRHVYPADVFEEGWIRVVSYR